MFQDKKVYAIIVAAGKGSRMGSNTPKQYLKLDDKTILDKTIDQFEKNKLVDEIILIINTEDIEYVKSSISYNRDKVTKVVEGGAERLDSVYNGIMSLDDDNSLVLIHDGVRPFVSQKLINTCIENTHEYKCCIPAIDVIDTIKVVEDDEVIETLDRSKLRAVQTPQGFEVKLLKELYNKAKNDNLKATDDASIAEYYGYKVKVIEGLRKNIKITTPFDFKIAEIISRMI